MASYLVPWITGPDQDLLEGAGIRPSVAKTTGAHRLETGARTASQDEARCLSRVPFNLVQTYKSTSIVG